MKSVEGQTAFITGGASGIGLGIAQAFLEAGARVVVADIRQDHLDRAAEEIGTTSNALFLKLDVTDRQAFEEAANAAEARFGAISILCNNAGVGVLGDIQSTRYADWDWTLAVNLGGVINGIQTFLPRMLGRPGHIVNTSSIGGMLPGPGGAAYLTSKAAIIGLSESMLCDLVDKEIGVTLLIPGPTQTNIHEVARLRPVFYSDTGLGAIESQLAEGPMFPNGRAPIETGRLVVQAVRDGQFYVFTHNQFREGVAERFQAILTGFAPGPADEEEAAQWGFPTYNHLFRKIVVDASAQTHKE
jgi:NAD(P)-dependent dehydrogenase (short-subunit alcohol dehydrogenase family)